MSVVIGYDFIDGVNKTTGVPYSGYNLWIVNKVYNKKNNPCGGYRWYSQKDKETKPFYVSQSVFNQLVDVTDGAVIFADIEPMFNQFGKIVGFKGVE